MQLNKYLRSNMYYLIFFVAVNKVFLNKQI